MKVKLKKPVAKREQPTVSYKTNSGKMRRYGVRRVKDCIRWRKKDITQIRGIAKKENRFMVDVIDDVLDAGLVALGYRTRRRKEDD